MYRALLGYIIQNRIQLLKFGCIGLAIFLLNFLSFQLLFQVFQFDYRIAVSLAFVLSVSMHYLLHRRFTFSAADQQIAQNAGKYVLMLGTNYLITLLVAWLVVEVLRMSPSYIVVIATAVTTLGNFFLMKYFVFKSKEAS